MKLLIIFLSLFLTSCSYSSLSNKENTKNVLNKITFFNKSKNNISEVSIVSLKTNKSLSCSVIILNTLCSYSFNQKLVNNNPLVINWISRGVKYSFEYKINDLKDKDYPLDIKIEIISNNKVRISGLREIK